MWSQSSTTTVPVDNSCSTSLVPVQYQYSTFTAPMEYPCTTCAAQAHLWELAILGEVETNCAMNAALE